APRGGLWLFTGAGAEGAHMGRQGAASGAEAAKLPAGIPNAPDPLRAGRGRTGNPPRSDRTAIWPERAFRRILGRIAARGAMSSAASPSPPRGAELSAPSQSANLFGLPALV
ncbi:hypothetical protein, partial [Paracoccus binzhouensis]|uniref:hypothetical protein n=1 Tax=Paracoccus binzhouensis TaxID=2796149 RepID=UPI001E42F3B0